MILKFKYYQRNIKRKTYWKNLKLKSLSTLKRSNKSFNKTLRNLTKLCKAKDKEELNKTKLTIETLKAKAILLSWMLNHSHNHHKEMIECLLEMILKTWSLQFRCREPVQLWEIKLEMLFNSYPHSIRKSQFLQMSNLATLIELVVSVYVKPPNFS